MVNTIALPPVVAEPTLAHDRYVTALKSAPRMVAGRRNSASAKLMAR